MNSHRFIDQSPYYFDYHHVLKTKGVWLVCSTCHHLAILQEKDKAFILTCQTCFKVEKITKHENKIYVYQYTGLCKKCGKYLRYDIEAHPYPIITKPCTACREINVLNLQKNAPISYKYQKVKFLENGLDPLTGKPLYFLETFKGKAFWALNLEHLNYLIAYVTADLRERDKSHLVWKTAGHTLPKFMKSSKNRETILHKLNKMKQKLK
ncbi:hypothetical protein SAMN04488559_12147 [Isobaculum melis]|uniref:Replication restart DNA helicase PriA n=2 Tax=Isobaculum melis TaxID=142588 RepID=A0A1H9U554_9LACT|nr:hypothetical protein SAMN04488559_12147 [Isobaculum melis]